MSTIEKTIAEGRKDFTRIVRETQTAKKDFVITRRGKPVAVIVPFEQYSSHKRLLLFDEIADLRRKLARSRVTAARLHADSRRDLERRS